MALFFQPQNQRKEMNKVQLNFYSLSHFYSNLVDDFAHESEKNTFNHFFIVKCQRCEQFMEETGDEIFDHLFSKSLIFFLLQKRASFKDLFS